MTASPTAKFAAIVEYAKRRIHSGEWRPGQRVPSENQLSESFDVSRMTARRALDRLALDGLVVRRRGAGSFIAENGVRSSFLVIRSIADEVIESGRSYSCHVLRHRVDAASRAVAEALELGLGSAVYHSLIVHLADGEALQLEYRYVRRDAAPEYLDSDLTSETPNHVLQRLCPLTFARQEISAALPTRVQCEALRIRVREPCLLITRITASQDRLVSYARILAPASRYQLSGQLHFSSKVPDGDVQAAMTSIPNDPHARIVRAPRGRVLHCRSWLTEAPYRMLQNNLDPEVAERPEELIVYGGIGKAARDWPAFERILGTLRRLADDESLLIQSGKPVGVFKTHPDAPRVLIANSNLVPGWADWETFHALDRKGLMMYGQMTAGSWIYIGSQGIVQGTYETFVACAERHFDADPGGRWILTGGLGGMGGAQPLAGTMAGFSVLAVECDPRRVASRLRTGYLDRSAATLDEALELIGEARARRRALSVSLVGNAAEVYRDLVARGVTPDVVTDQTAAHDPLNGYLPIGWTLEAAKAARRDEPARIVAAARASMKVQVEAMLAMQARGAVAFDYGNNIRQEALDAGVERAFDIPGFVPEYIRPLFCKGIGPFRWVALSGNPEDIYRTDAKVKELIPDAPSLHRWLDLAKARIHFQGLPARICWVGLEDRARIGIAFNQMVASGELEAPVVIGRDHLDSGSVASPNRETEAMMDGSDAVSDWPLLNALLNTAGGATWVSIHHGGGVGMGNSQHAGVVIVCDGTPAAEARLRRVLHNDPATGVMRHADAGYESAIRCAREQGLDLPSLEH